MLRTFSNRTNEMRAGLARVLFMLILGAWAVIARAAPLLHVEDLPVGKDATIKARIGEHVVTREKAGLSVFTMRDDFGRLAYGYTGKDTSGIRFGATYFVRGVRRAESGSKEVDLDVDSWELAYPPSPSTGTGIWWVVAAILAALLIGFGILWRRSKKVLEKEPWDYAEILTGPDQGKLIPLKEAEIPVGRRKDPDHCISIVQDTYVSRDHGSIIRRGDQVFFRDSGSRCGSFVDERQVESGEEELVLPGSIIRLGPHTTLRIGTAPNEETRFFTDSPYPSPESWQDTQL